MMTPQRSATLLRAGLFALAFEAGLIGVHALFFPQYFYSEFLLGRGWVQMLPPYNEHITRDLGALYLGFFFLMSYAAVKLSRDLVNGAIVSFMVATIPHMVFHAIHTEDAPLLIDKILQVGLLALTVAFGVLLLWLGRRYFDGTAPGGTAAPVVRQEQGAAR
jgi:hypothetical protein